MSDGSITANVELDDSQAQAELNRLEKKITSLEEKLNEQKYNRTPLADDAARLGAELESANAKLAEMQNSHQYTTEQIANQADAVRNLTAQYNQADSALQRQDASIAKTEQSLEYAKMRAGDLEERLAGVGESGSSAGTMISDAMQAAEKRMQKFERRIIGLARRVFVFTLVTKALRGVREYVANAIKTNDEASASIAKLKLALQTLAQPLFSVVIPAFITLVNAITRVVTVLAQLFAMLTGGTLKQSEDAAAALDKETAALKKTGGAAKKAGKELANFDEVNKLDDSSGGGGAGGAGGLNVSLDEQDEAMLNKVLTIVELIGSAIAAWRIGKALGLDLEKTLGVMLAIYSAIEFVKNIFDMWNNGATLENLTKSLIDLLGIVVGLGVAFGPVAAGIALVVGGLTLLVTGFHDAMENGMDLANTLTIIAGIVATGLGLAILTHSVIPALIAGFAAVMVALVFFTGHGEELISGLKQVIEGFAQFFKGVFAGDIKQSVDGLKLVWDGLKTMWNAVVDSIKDAWNSFVTWFDEKTNGKFHSIIETIEKLVSGIYDTVVTILTGVVDFIAGVFTLDIERIGKGLCNIIIGLFNGVIVAFEGALNLWVSALNVLINGLNWVADNLPGGIGKGIAIPLVSTVNLGRIPALAQGAVIPPNREFLAVLGDQKSGTNIEAPLDTLTQAFRQVMSEQGGRNMTVILEVDRIPFAKAVFNAYNTESQRIGLSLGAS